MNAYRLKNQEKAIVLALPSHLKQQLMIHGIYVGCMLMKVGSAPLFDPIIFQVGESLVALRKADAENIIVEKVVPNERNRFCR